MQLKSRLTESCSKTTVTEICTQNEPSFLTQNLLKVINILHVCACINSCAKLIKYFL